MHLFLGLSFRAWLYGARSSWRAFERVRRGIRSGERKGVVREESMVEYIGIWTWEV